MKQPPIPMSLFLPRTLSLYLLRKFLLLFSCLYLFFFAIIAIVYCIDSARSIDRTLSQTTLASIHLGQTLLFSAFEAPKMLGELLPILLLVATLLLCIEGARKLEWMALRAAGISAFQWILPILGISFLLGSLASFGHQPVATYLREYVHLSNRESSTLSSAADLEKERIWIQEKKENSFLLLLIEKLAVQGKQGKGLALLLDQNFRLQERIASPAVTFEQGEWKFLQAQQIQIGKEKEAIHYPIYRIPSLFTQEEVETFLEHAVEISFWELPKKIRILEKAGLPTTAFRAEWLFLWVQPLFWVSLVLLSAAPALEWSRSPRLFPKILLGFFPGMFLYYFAKILLLLAKSSWLPVWVAIFSPLMLSFSLGLFFFLRKEDG